MFWSNKRFFWVAVCIIIFLSGMQLLYVVFWKSHVSGHLIGPRQPIDLGRLEKDEKRSTSFILLNDSAKPISIKEVTANCGCTVASPGKKALLPGETTTVDVTFNGRGFWRE